MSNFMERVKTPEGNEYWKIESCPECGSDHVDVRYDDDDGVLSTKYYVCCDHCGHMSPFYAGNEYRAIEEWNEHCHWGDQKESQKAA